MNLWDTHIHTEYSIDCEEKVENIIRGGLNRGLAGMIFTDHLDLDMPGEKHRYPGIDFYSYIPEMKEKISNMDTGNMQFGIGIEMGMQTHTLKENLEIVEAHDFDYRIGSVHFIRGKDPYYDDFFTDVEDLDGCMQEVFSITYDNLLLYKDHIDSLGHLDYVLRYANRHARENGLKEVHSEPNDIVREILMCLIKNDICLEVNTGAYRSGLFEPHPSYSILREYKNLGGQAITIGSDAHYEKHVALEFEQVRDMLKDIGFRSFFVFKNRRPMELPL